MLLAIFLKTAAKWFARTLLVALALVALLVAALALGAATPKETGILLYGPIALTEARGVRHADCGGASWGYLRPGAVAAFQRAAWSGTVRQWLEAEPHPRESSAGCGDELAEGTPIRLYLHDNPRPATMNVVHIHIYGGTYAEFRDHLLNP